MEMKLLAGKKVLLTAGSTHEPIDSIRYFSESSGNKIGYEIAESLLKHGAEIYLITGPGQVGLAHPNLSLITVQTACDMYMACCKLFEDCDIAIFAAAIPEYKPKEIVQEYGVEAGINV